MDAYFDFEEAIKSVKSKRIQIYLQEVLSTYHNGEYRSCIVMLYATTFADALEKIKTMSEVYQNEKATKFLEKYDEDRKANKAYSALEREIKEFVEKSGLINDVEKKQWEHLKDYRDYCAHPVVENEYKLISPNSEQVRMHIRNMFEALFLKDAILTDSKLFDEFLSKVESFFDRNGIEGLEEYMNTRYINKLDLKTKGKFIKSLWKFTFYINDEECDKYRLVSLMALIWIINSDKSNTLNLMESDMTFLNGKIDFQDISIDKDEKDFNFSDNKTLALFLFLYKVPKVYSLLSPDNQTEIKSISKQNINLTLMTPYLYETTQAHIDEITKGLNGLNYCLKTAVVNNLLKQAYKRFNYEYNDLVIYYFFNCQNSSAWAPDWDYINSTYKEIISPALPHFTQKQIETFLSNLTDFYAQANCFGSMANKIVKVVSDRDYDVDFSTYSVNLTEYIEEQVESNLDDSL